jgi:hypothetical protein
MIRALTASTILLATLAVGCGDEADVDGEATSSQVTDRDDGNFGHSAEALSSGPFVHPGILVNRGMLDFVKQRIATNAQPWKSAFDRAKADRLGSLSYVPHPYDYVRCGPFSQNPSVGCADEKDDADANSTRARRLKS